MVLNADKERMISQFNDLYQSRTGVSTAGDHPRLFKLIEVFIVEFPAVTMPLADNRFSIYPVGQGTLFYLTGISTQSHSAAFRSYFFLLFHQVYYRFVGIRIHFG